MYNYHLQIHVHAIVINKIQIHFIKRSKGLISDKLFISKTQQHYKEIISGHLLLFVFNGILALLVYPHFRRINDTLMGK